jgi:hypothetical protein
MSDKAGRLVLIFITDGAGGWSNFAGMTEKQLEIKTDREDTTLPDNSNPSEVPVKSQLAVAKSVSFSGDYQTENDVAEKRALSQAIGGKGTDLFKIEWPQIGTITGNFDFDLSFSAGAKSTGKIDAQSNGAFTFVPAS